MSRTSATAETTNTLLARSAEPVFDSLAVVGVGLLGGSVALAAKRYGTIRRVIGVGRNAARLMQAQAAGVIDETAADLRNAASRADLLVFATPVQLIVPGVREAAKAARSGTVITDVGSTKARICRELSSGLPDGVTFVGSHPLAGSEKQGWEHARADLFDGRVCVVTSSEKVCLTDFWRAIGMTVIEMSPEAHDRALAQTSHVPHAIASALARTLADENRPLAATGFADSTRIAAGDPNVWVPILLDNADAVLMSLDVFSAELSALREALARRDATKIRELWERGKTVREAIKVRRIDEGSSL
jgi:prephenate dehydrogenase